MSKKRPQEVRRRTVSEIVQQPSGAGSNDFRRHTLHTNSSTGLQALQRTSYNSVTVKGRCIATQKAELNTEHTFIVTTPSSGTLGVSIYEPSGTFADTKVTQDTHLVYQCDFVPKESGLHKVMVCYNEMNIAGSPFQIDVQPKSSHSHGVRSTAPPTYQNTAVIPDDPAILNQNEMNSFIEDESLNAQGPQMVYQNVDSKPRKVGTNLGLWHRVPNELRTKLQPHVIKSAELTVGKQLGKGHFGKVCEVRVSESQRGASIAAAKSIRASGVTDDDIAEFLSEAILMSNFKHHNVLDLIGIVIQMGLPYILFPVMTNGSLKEYVTQRKNQLTPDVLLSFSHQVAVGMSYISELKFVHRDLAARNCLLSRDLVVKISDFGLARDNFEADYKMMKIHKNLPLRWLAPEILREWTFTSETDVWAFGVLLWEVFSYGERPYGKLDDCYLSSWLESGSRLEKPEAAPQQIYTLMLGCWKLDPTERPKFKTTADEIQSCLDDINSSHNYATPIPDTHNYVNPTGMAHEYNNPSPATRNYVNPSR